MQARYMASCFLQKCHLSNNISVFLGGGWRIIAERHVANANAVVVVIRYLYARYKLDSSNITTWPNNSLYIYFIETFAFTTLMMY